MFSILDIHHRMPPQGDRVAAFLTERGTAVVARLGELVQATDQPALVAEEQGRVVGVLTYILGGAGCEVLTLHTARPWQGVGTALLAELDRLARAQGCARVWLTTTNDNLDALRFYQRRGFRLAAVHPGAVDVARAELKPTISVAGNYGIPIRDELVLEKLL